MRELSWLAIVLGVVIGALLAAANAFVGLKVGMTISASIPAAVMSLLILRTLLKRGTLLESNMVQTIGSAGESVAAGMIFTLPALFIMGENPKYLEMIIWGGLGGLLGVCFMVPLRRVLIVREHGVLPYPEGVACAEVLQSGERGGSGAKSVLWGAVVGAVYYFFTGLGFWKESGVIALRRFRTEAQMDSSPALLGVGYILGARIAGIMLGGAILSWFILIPAVGFFGAGMTEVVFPATDRLIADMTPQEVYKSYVRYIGAGAVAIGGLISLFKSIPTILSSLWHVIAGVLRIERGPKLRTDRDIPFTLLLLIIAGLAYFMWKSPIVRLDHLGVVAVVVFTFFFVTVSSRLVGIVGGSSNPVSGMTIATLLATALVYRFFVMGDGAEMSDEALTQLKVTCLSIGAIVCIAITIGGDTSQDLKTGFLVKATPYKQQIGEMIGILTSVVAIAGLLLLLNKTYGFTPDRTDPLPAYQANIMKILVEGVLGGQVPWTLIMMGGAAAIIVEMLGVPALPFAVGMYLPLGLSAPIMVGGLVRWLVDRRKGDRQEHDPGVLTASGLVAGMGLMGVAFAGVLALIAWIWSNPQWVNPLSGASEGVSYAHLAPWLWTKLDVLSMKWGLSDAWWDALPLFPFALLTLWLWWCARKIPPVKLPPAPPVTTGPPDPVMPGDAPKPPMPGPTERRPVAPDDVAPASNAPEVALTPDAIDDAIANMLSSDSTGATPDRGDDTERAAKRENGGPSQPTPDAAAPVVPEDAVTPDAIDDAIAQMWGSDSTDTVVNLGDDAGESARQTDSKPSPDADAAPWSARDEKRVERTPSGENAPDHLRLDEDSESDDGGFGEGGESQDRGRGGSDTGGDPYHDENTDRPY